MFQDQDFRAEVLSSILGRKFILYDDKINKTRAKVLFYEEYIGGKILAKQYIDKNKWLIDQKDFFDPQYDYDFTDLSDPAECMRGDEPYKRPIGWYRMALKVLGRYPDGDTWLGPDGWRSHSVAGEWPVSYHGTTLDGARGIIKSHYMAEAGAAYGTGIYSTPDLHVAEKEKYAMTFKSKKMGKSYKLILQNRINPERFKKCKRPGYWLIPVDEGTSALEEEEIAEGAIRPYGILIKEMK